MVSFTSFLPRTAKFITTFTSISLLFFVLHSVSSISQASNYPPIIYSTPDRASAVVSFDNSTTTLDFTLYPYGYTLDELAELGIDPNDLDYGYYNTPIISCSGIEPEDRKECIKDGYRQITSSIDSTKYCKHQTMGYPTLAEYVSRGGVEEDYGSWINWKQCDVVFEEPVCEITLREFSYDVTCSVQYNYFYEYDSLYNGEITDTIKGTPDEYIITNYIDGEFDSINTSTPGTSTQSFIDSYKDVISPDILCPNPEVPEYTVLYNKYTLAKIFSEQGVNLEGVGECGPVSGSSHELINTLIPLTELYASLSGTSWIDNTNWLNEGDTLCDWYGISCSSQAIEGRAGEYYHIVTSINLSNNDLTGAIPDSFYFVVDSLLGHHANFSWDLGAKNPEITPLPEAVVTDYPLLLSKLKTTPSLVTKFGDKVCYPDTEAFAAEFEGTNWQQYICGTEEESCPVENTGPECLSGNPINTRTGVKIQTSTDYAASGLSPLRIKRNYNSSKRAWQFNTNTQSLLLSGNYVKLKGRSKSNYLFYCSAPAPSTCSAQKLIGQSETYQTYKLNKLIDGYTLTLPSGASEIYSTIGQLASTTNTQGRVLSYSYGANTTTVTDEFAQQITLTTNADNLVSQAVTPIGSFTYDYDEFNRLITVTKPDNNTIGYSYDEEIYSTVQYYESYVQSCSGDDYLTIDACKSLVKNLGLLTGKIDETGQRASSWYYDEQQRAYKSEHGRGIDVTEIQFVSETVVDGLGNPTAIQRVRDVISPLDQRTRTTFRSPYGQRAEKIEYFDSADSLTATELYSYDSNGYESEYIDINGLKTTYSRYSDSREYSRVENAGTANTRTISTSYSGNTNKPTQITTPETRVNISYINHNSGLLISKQTTTDLSTNKQRITNFSYNAQGQLISIDGPRTDITDITTFEYNAQGLKNKSTNALGHITQITAFNAHGKPLTLVDENNITTTLTYDVMGSMLSYERSGLTVTFTYDLNGALTSATSSDGTTINYEYDSANRLVAIEDNIYNRIEYTLDNAGNKLTTTIKDPASTLRFHQQQLFDEFGRITGLVDGNNNSESKQYLANGLLDREFDALSYSDDYAYNALAQLSSITAPDTGTTTFSYDNAGRANSITDAEGKITTYTYNGFGELIEEVNPNTGTTTYLYDEAGNITQKQQSSGVEIRATTYQYDALNRIISDSAQSVIYSYDDTTNGNVGIGKLTGITDEGGSTQIVYNTHGSVTSETRLINGQPFTTTYQYDSLERLVGMTYPNGREINYTLDSKAQIAAISMTMEGVTSALASNIQYLPFGPMTSYTFGNGLTKSMIFDNNYQMSSNNTTGVEDLSYSYTARNNINAITDILDSSVDQTFNYSPVSALSGATGSYGNLGFGYDLILNRASHTKDGSTDTYTYETGKHLLQSISGSSTTNFTYNGFGDTTQKDSTSFIYNNTGRLSSVDGSDLTNYQYDYQGRRLSKSNSLGTVYYLYDLNGLLIAESDDGGNITTEYTYLNGQLLSTIGSTVSAPVSEEVIVDNEESNTSSIGSWSLQNDRKNKAYGANFMLASGGTGSTYSWQPILMGGTYEVYAYWTTNRKYSKSAPYTISHAGINDVISVDQTANGTQWNLLGTFNFTGDGSEYVELSDSNGKVVADAIKLVRVDSGQLAESVLAFVHNNHLGAPVHLTDTSGNVLWKASYSPFGKATINNDVDGDNKPIEMNVRFPGQYFDEESGLHYNWNRYYDNETGRYITSDPLGLSAGMNTYGYVGGNPINYVDPFGLDMKGIFLGLVIHNIDVDYLELTAVNPFYKDESGLTVIGNHNFNAFIEFSLKLKCTEKDDCGEEDVTYKAIQGAYTAKNIQLPVKDSWLPIIPALIVKASYAWDARNSAVKGLGEKLKSYDLNAIATLGCQNKDILKFMLNLH